MGEPIATGVDIGGTNVRAAAVTGDGDVLGVLRAPSPDADLDALLATVAGLVRELDVDGPVGVGIAGGVTADGTLCGAPNLGIDGVPIRAELREVLDRDVHVVNDAAAATWAEHRVGAGRDVDDLVMLTLGTGVGGGAVVGGRLLTGATGLGGELGHILVQDGGRRCGCGNQGCLEPYASGAAMAMGQRAGDEVVAAANAGEHAALTHLAGVGRWVGVGLASLVNALDPALLVLGGGAGEAAFDVVAPPARDALAERLFGRGHREPPPVVPAELGDRAGVVGAALLAVTAETEVAP